MAEFDFSQAIGEARAKYESISKALDVDRLTAQAKDLEVQAAEPGLWDDPENAQKVTSKLSAVQSQLKRLSSASQRIETSKRSWNWGRKKTTPTRWRKRGPKSKAFRTIWQTWKSRPCLTANTTNVPQW